MPPKAKINVAVVGASHVETGVTHRPSFVPSRGGGFQMVTCGYSGITASELLQKFTKDGKGKDAPLHAALGGAGSSY